jgi:iron complex outermembrane recepter protein
MFFKNCVKHVSGKPAKIGLVSVSTLAIIAFSNAANAQESPATEADSEEIVVTGVTSKNRTLISSSVDATLISGEDLDRKAARSTAEVLELVPGIFVEGSAGPVSNNYSVRGLAGGGQTFINIEEDGLAVMYNGDRSDRFYRHDLTVGRVEAIRGGPSGVLSVNGSAAVINFISKQPNFDRAEGVVRFTGTSYDEKRAELYYTSPIAQNLAFSIGGGMYSTRGVRKTPFTYDGYNIKAILKSKFDNGGHVSVTFKKSADKSPFYAGSAYRIDANGKPRDLPSFDAREDTYESSQLANVLIPVSPFTGRQYKPFKLKDGVDTDTWSIGGDIEYPVSDNIDLFLRTRGTRYSTNFNGIFTGPFGNTSIVSAVTYLTPGAASPINGLLTQGLASFPTTAQFGIRNLTTGQVIPASNTNALNALNGNGFLQLTVLNNAFEKGNHFASEFGGRYESEGENIKNSLTVGGMYYRRRNRVDQAGVSTAVIDLKDDANLIDIVALGAGGNVLGTLTNNGLTTYGNWGQGQWITDEKSLSLFLNDELKIGDNLFLDAGVRYEMLDSSVLIGNAAAVNFPVPVGTPGATQNIGGSFDGTYTRQERSPNKFSWTLGANYMFSPTFAAYARYAHGFQTFSGNPGGVPRPANVDLYEAGLRYQTRNLSASLTAFRTTFANQSYGFLDPVNPQLGGSFVADLATNGIEVNFNYRPASFFRIDAFGVLQKPKLGSTEINGVSQPQFSGNRPERTPGKLFTITPAFVLPDGKGEVFLRYKHIGKIFADAGNGLALPSYGVISIGADYNITDNLNLAFNVDNLTNVIGLTEGNPRAGATQSAPNQYFYARGIAGRNAQASITLKF